MSSSYLFEPLIALFSLGIIPLLNLCANKGLLICNSLAFIRVAVIFIPSATRWCLSSEAVLFLSTTSTYSFFIAAFFHILAHWGRDVSDSESKWKERRLRHVAMLAPDRLWWCDVSCILYSNVFVRRCCCSSHSCISEQHVRRSTSHTQCQVVMWMLQSSISLFFLAFHAHNSATRYCL